MLNIVLYQPEIPFNTANIIRTCVAIGASLHIIEPCGFDLSKDHPDLKRGSTNFINVVDLNTYPSFENFVEENNITEENFAILTRYGQKIYSDVKYNNKDDLFLMFGSESTGVPKEIIKRYLKNSFRIPMDEKMRSLNLSNCVALVGYDMIRQGGFAGLAFEEVQKIDFLD